MKVPKTDWLQVYSGDSFYPLEPEFSKVDIYDIAHSLSLLCRYGGHTKEFYSVAEHSIMVSHLVSSDNALWGLLHDASEAYLVDLPRPIKIHMPDYIAAEKRLMRHICNNFRLNENEPTEVKEADCRITCNERTLLNPPINQWDSKWLHKPFENIFFMLYDPKTAEKKFLERFFQLTKETK